MSLHLTAFCLLPPHFPVTRPAHVGQSASASAQSVGVVTLALRASPSTTWTATPASPSRPASSVGASPPCDGVGAGEQRARRALRRLHRPQARPLDRRPEPAVPRRPQRVRDRHGGRRGAVRADARDDARDEIGRHERPHRVVHEHDLDGLGQRLDAVPHRRRPRRPARDDRRLDPERVEHRPRLGQTRARRRDDDRPDVRVPGERPERLHKHRRVAEPAELLRRPAHARPRAAGGQHDANG